MPATIDGHSRPVRCRARRYMPMPDAMNEKKMIALNASVGVVEVRVGAGRENDRVGGDQRERHEQGGDARQAQRILPREHRRDAGNIEASPPTDAFTRKPLTHRKETINKGSSTVRMCCGLHWMGYTLSDAGAPRRKENPPEGCRRRRVPRTGPRVRTRQARRRRPSRRTTRTPPD